MLEILKRVDENSPVNNNGDIIEGEEEGELQQRLSEIDLGMMM